MVEYSQSYRKAGGQKRETEMKSAYWVFAVFMTAFLITVVARTSAPESVRLSPPITK